MAIVLEKDGKRHFTSHLILLITNQSNDEVISILKNVQVQDLTDHKGATLLHHAAHCGNVVITQHLIARGCNVDATDALGRTPLRFAIGEVRVDTTKILLNANAKIGKFCDENFLLDCPMMRREPNDLAIIETLFTKITSGCIDNNEIALKLIEYECPLPGVIFLKNPQLTKLMLSLGCYVNDRLPLSNETALHVAVSLSDIANIKVLVEHGADVNAMDIVGRPPLACFEMSEDDEDEKLDTLRFLLDRGASFDTADVNGPLTNKVLSEGDVRTVRALLPYIDLSRVGEKGRSAFDYIVRNKNDGVIDLLQGKSCNINARDEDGLTALQHLLNDPSTHVRMVQFLLENGADPNNVNNDGVSALFIILWNDGSVDAEKSRRIVELLLQYGADAQFLGPHGRSVIHGNSKDEFILLQPVFAHLAMIESFGMPLNDIVREDIEASDMYKNYFETCKKQIALMKDIVLYESVTLHSLLFEKKEKIAMYSRNQEFASNYIFCRCNIIQHLLLDSYYNSTLFLRIDMTLELVQLQKCAAFVVCELMSLPYSMIDVIGREVAQYLQYEDLQNMLRVGITRNMFEIIEPVDPLKNDLMIKLPI